eukprot:2802979-Amphidinium_carterae.1
MYGMHHPLPDQKIPTTGYYVQRQKSNLPQPTSRHLKTMASGLPSLSLTRVVGRPPQPQLAGRADSSALVWRQRAGPKMRGSQSLSVRHVSKIRMLRA